MKKIVSLLLKNRGLKQTVLKNTFWLFIGQVMGRVLRGFLVIYSARVLGAASWGIFSYAIGLVAFLTIFTDLGINALITKNTAGLKTDGAEKVRQEIISTSFFIKIILILLGLAVLLFFGPVISKIKDAIPLFPIVAFILIFDNLREFGFSITRAMEKMEVEAFFFILTNLAIVIFGFVFLMLDPTPISLAYAYVVGTAIGMFSTFYFLRKYFRHIFKYFKQDLIRPIITSAWPFAMIGIMGSLMINTDIVLLGWFRTAEELGFYSAAQKPVQILYVLPALLATSIFPVLARLAGKDDEKVAQIISRTISSLLWIAVPIAVIGILLGKEIIQLVYGVSYLPAVISWQILITTILAVFPGTIIGNSIFAYNKQKLFIKSATIGALSNIVLDLVFIPIWGAPGSAAATVIAQFATNIFLWNKLKKINPNIKLRLKFW